MPHDENGHWYDDEGPMALPVHFVRPPTLQESIAAALRSHHMDQLAQSQGFETFDEADDFDVGEDFDPSSPHELCFDPLLNKEVTKPHKKILDSERAAFDEYVKKERIKSKTITRKKKAVEEQLELPD